MKPPEPEVAPRRRCFAVGAAAEMSNTDGTRPVTIPHPRGREGHQEDAGFQEKTHSSFHDLIIPRTGLGQAISCILWERNIS